MLRAISANSWPDVRDHRLRQRAVIVLTYWEDLHPREVAGRLGITEGEDTVSFESDPTDEVMWVRNDAFVRVASPCEGQVGEYAVTFVSSDRFTLDVVWDECTTRVTVANGLELRLGG